MVLKSFTMPQGASKPIHYAPRSAFSHLHDPLRSRYDSCVLNLQQYLRPLTGLLTLCLLINDRCFRRNYTCFAPYFPHIFIHINTSSLCFHLDFSFLYLPSKLSQFCSCCLQNVKMNNKMKLLHHIKTLH